jgi:hypothetical protein
MRKVPIIVHWRRTPKSGQRKEQQYVYIVDRSAHLLIYDYTKVAARRRIHSGG